MFKPFASLHCGHESCGHYIRKGVMTRIHLDSKRALVYNKRIRESRPQHLCWPTDRLGSLVACLLLQRLSNLLMYLRDGSASTILRGETLR